MVNFNGYVSLPEGIDGDSSTFEWGADVKTTWGHDKIHFPNWMPNSNLSKKSGSMDHGNSWLLTMWGPPVMLDGL